MSAKNFIVLSVGSVTEDEILEQISRGIGSILTDNSECHIFSATTKPNVMAADNLYFVDVVNDKTKIRKVF